MNYLIWKYRQITTSNMTLSYFSVNQLGLNANGILLSKIIEHESRLYFCTHNKMEIR